MWDVTCRMRLYAQKPSIIASFIIFPISSRLPHIPELRVLLTLRFLQHSFRLSPNMNLMEHLILARHVVVTASGQDVLDNSHQLFDWFYTSCRAVDSWYKAFHIRCFNGICIHSCIFSKFGEMFLNNIIYNRLLSFSVPAVHVSKSLIAATFRAFFLTLSCTGPYNLDWASSWSLKQFWNLL